MKVLWCNLWCEDVRGESSHDIKKYRKGEDVKFDVLDSSNKPCGTFTLVPFPGCPGVLVSTSSSYDGPYGQDFHGLKELAAKLLGASALIATVDVLNIKEAVSASKAGWRMRDAFLNEHGTGNHIAFWIKVINRVGREKERAPVPDEYEVPHLD